MPQRSNEFQRLIYFVQKALADDAEVHESMFLVDSATGAQREVDVFVKGETGGHEVMVSIECRDHQRKADVGWVEQMAAKHQRLPTNALILASKSGFSANALEVARYYNAKTISFDEIEQTDYASLLDATSDLWAKTFSVSPEKVVFVVEFADGSRTERVAVSRDQYLHSADGDVIGTAEQLVGRLLHSSLMRDYLFKHGDTEHQSFTLDWDAKAANLEKPFYLKSLSPEELREILSVEIRGPCTVKVENFAIKQAKIADVTVAWGEPSLLGDDAILVATRDESGQEKLAVKVGGKEIDVRTPE